MKKIYCLPLTLFALVSAYSQQNPGAENKVASTKAPGFFDFVSGFLRQLDTQIIPKLLSMLYVIILGLIIIRVLTMILRKAAKKKINERSMNLLIRVIQYTGMAVIVINILKIAEIDLTPLLGAAGIVGIALGFAAQTSVSNLISGLFLLSEKLFAAGDLVTINDITGIVFSIDTLSIKIRTFDNKLIRIANTNVISSTVINITRFPIRRINLVFTVPHDCDTTVVQKLLVHIAEGLPTALRNPPPFFMINGITKDGIELFFGVWFDINDWEPTYMGMYNGILNRFPEAGIKFAHTKINVDGLSEAALTGYKHTAKH